MKFRIKWQDKYWLILICITAFILRIKGLTYQSLWLDELHTMNEADPSITWSRLFHYLKTSDQHPPLFFIIERIAFTIFGHTEYVARFITAIAGTAGVAAMYKLGKEMLNRRLGIICAILLTFNYYHISYSQEARPYIFAFLFTVLSFTYFIRLIRMPAKGSAVSYAVFTLLMLYSHYFGLFVLASQFVAAIIFIFQETGIERKLLFRKFLFSAIIIIIGYAPCMPLLGAVGKIRSFWIHETQASFIQDYVFEYFGNTDLLKPLIILLLFTFFARVALTTGSLVKKIKDDPLSMSFVIVLTWVFISMLVPYLRSILVVPMMHPRYTIVVLPAIIIAISIAIESFSTRLIKYMITVLFVLLSSIHLFVVDKYYTKVSKTQFREMTRFIVDENSSGFPVINELTGWHQEYYLKKYGSTASMISGKKEILVDSILRGASAGNQVKGFWIAGAHGDKEISDSLRNALDTAFIQVQHRSFFDAWAALYVFKNYRDSSFVVLNYNDFKGGEGSALPADKLIGIWNGSVHLKPFYLKEGEYSVTIQAMGTMAGGQYPHISIFFNGKKTGEYFVSGKIEEKTFSFENFMDADIDIMIRLDNDLFTPATKEDRNVFLRSVIIRRGKE